MENYKQNPSVEPNNRRKRGLRALLVTLALAGVATLSYFGYQNPELFRADLTSKGLPSTFKAGVNSIYIPTYEANSGDSGSLAVKLNSSTITTPQLEEDVVSVKFKLKYSPADALEFNANSLIFDNTTLFSGADLKSVNTQTKGEVVVSMFSNKPARFKAFAQDPTLFKLATTVKSPNGTTIKLSTSEVEVIKKVNGLVQQSQLFNSVAVDEIKVVTPKTGQLKLLYTEVLDSTHILLKFSDLLLNTGSRFDYDIDYYDSAQKAFDGGGPDANLKRDFYVPSNYTSFEDELGFIEIYAGQDVKGVRDMSFSLKFNTTNASFVQSYKAGTLFANEPNLSAITVAPDTLVVSVANGAFANNRTYDFKPGDLLLKVQVKVNKGVPVGTDLPLMFSVASIADAASAQFRTATTSHGNIKVNSANKKLTITSVASGLNHPLCSTCDQSFVILEGEVQKPNLSYQMAIKPSGPRGNLQGGLVTGHNKGLFLGYVKPDAKKSAVKLKAIRSTSSTEVLLDFDGDLDEKTATPVNILISDLLSLKKMTIAKVDMITKRQLKITMSDRQVGGLNYQVAFQGVKDISGKDLINNLLLNFTGYQVPALSVSQVKPNSVQNDQAQKIVLLGQNLDTVKEARIGNTKVAFSGATSGAITLEIPKLFKVGSYDIALLTKDQKTEVIKNALVITAAQTPFRVVSSESKSVPKKVAPDGKTKVKLYALVEDPVDIASVTSVTIDLSPIGGGRAIEMKKDTGVQKKGQQFFILETTVSEKTPTKSTPYLLKVQAKKGATVTDGTVEIVVTKDVLASVAPVIEQVYVNPTTVSPDGKTPVKISAKITDADGANTLQSVIADLGSLGIGFVQLKPFNTGAKVGEQSTAFYESAEFKVPTTTKKGKYKVSVTATDQTGEVAKSEIELEVSQSLSGPKFDPSKSYVGPRKSVPNDGKTPFSINVMVSDSDGISDVDNVIAYFTSMGLKPVTLTKDAKTSTNAKSALYTSGPITIPTSTPLNVHSIQVVATDKSGAQANLTLKIDVTYEDTVGDAPIVFSKKSYTTPKVALNDGKTPLTLYAFVRDDDQDLESVIVNLKGVGQVGPETPAEFGSANTPAIKAGNGGCPTGSNTIVCMKPSFTEGRDGQWFVLSDVTISSRTAASQKPYEVEVIATDKGRKVGRGKIQITVQDSAGFTPDKTSPEVVGAVPVSPGKIEVIFSEPLLTSSVSSSGKEFSITKKSDINQKLSVVGSTINVEGNIVTLTTAKQSSNDDYVLTVSSVQDLSGLPVGRQNKASFKGFKEGRRGPVIHLVSATDPETVEIEFQEPIRPSSVELGSSSTKRGDEFNVRIYEAGNPSAVLPIKAVYLLDGGKVLQVKTNAQKSTQRYQVQVSDLVSSNGQALKNTANKFFKAINYRAVQAQKNASGADLNGDGKVDFIDFTLFSASYGKVFGQPSGASSGQAGQGLQPITPKPNAAVPTTSTPNGGR